MDEERQTIITYSGGIVDNNQFDELIELYSKYGLTIQVTTDGPYVDPEDD